MEGLTSIEGDSMLSLRPSRVSDGPLALILFTR